MSRVLFLSVLVASSSFTLAAESDYLDPIEITNPKIHETVKVEELPSALISSDSASLLNMTPGISLKTGGGLSSLPVMQGMADDRINVKIDGATITSSCPNHMNPALSYIDPSKISSIEVMAGITPVSHGGDSIGGSILVNSKRPVFSSVSDKLKQGLNLSSYFKSNNENMGASLSYDVATEDLFIGYSGMDEKANNYRNGNGDRLKGTLYNQNNQAATIGKKLDDGVLVLKLTRAVVPYQGFINQYMDLTDNVSHLGNLSYVGRIGEVFLDSSIFYQHTNHYMDKITSQRPGAMPMYTRSDEMGYKVKATVEASKRHDVNVGSDYTFYRLDDWWPAVPGSAMMGPGTFQSINNGKRKRLGFFVEADSQWSKDLSTNLGLRTDMVSMDTGDVVGYNTTNNLPPDASHFNAQSHSKYDQNIDGTLSSKLKVNSFFDFELGFGRKTRSPNLYERYSWAGLVTDPTGMGMPSMGTAMDMRMINWFGDGNGYVGDIGLMPEVAHKVSASFVFHDDSSKYWEFKLTPYYSEVQDFIDADLIGNTGGRNYLKFANHDAVIFGADLSAGAKFFRHQSLGEFNLKLIGSYTRGYRKDGKSNLYHLMPLNGKVALQHQKGKWTSDLVTHLVHKKEQVNDLRLEPTTAGYALLDVGTSYQVTSLIKIDFTITNVLDHDYGLPLGGVDLVNHTPADHIPVGGMGRSFNTSVSVDFF